MLVWSGERRQAGGVGRTEAYGWLEVLLAFGLCTHEFLITY